jgi:hypothetical protein
VSILEGGREGGIRAREKGGGGGRRTNGLDWAGARAVADGVVASCPVLVQVDLRLENKRSINLVFVYSLKPMINGLFKFNTKIKIE